MVVYKEYIIRVEGEKYPFFDIENIVITNIKNIGDKIEIGYDFNVVSRMDRKWSLKRREKRIVSLSEIRSELRNEIINQILDV